jgi:colanic acid biosynthesis glycosyl transferase WcaI
MPRPDVLIATSPQLLVALSGWWLAFVKRVPFVFEVRDLWPESLTAVGIGGERTLLIKVLRTIAGFLYRRASRIVVVTAAFKSFLIDHWAVPADKIFVVENGVETDLFRPMPDRDATRADLEMEGKFVVCYTGTIGLAHGLETLIEVAEILVTENPRVHFLLIGEGADKQRIVDLVTSRCLNNVKFLGQQPREKISSLVSAADACVVLLRKAELFKTVIPTKMLEFMSCGLPVVLAVDGQARTILEEAGAGIYVEPENAAQMAAAITTLFSDAQLRAEMGRSGREYVIRNLSRRDTATRYAAILHELIAENKPSAAPPDSTAE